MGFQHVQMSVSLILVSSLELFSLCLFLFNSNGLVFILFYYYPLEYYLFSNEKQKGGRFRWEGGGAIGEVEEGKIIIRMYYVRKISIF